MGGTATFPPPTSSQPTPASKPASGGLKQCWDLKEPQLGEVGSSEQAKKFSQAFKAAIDPVNRCLQYTKCNAEKEKHEAMVAKRDYQYTNYQSVQGQIDPKDEAKAKGPIDQYLNQTRALAGEANTLKQQTEKSVNAWKAKEAAFDKAVLQVEELRDFKFKDLKAHSDLATEIQTAVNVHKFDDAVAKFGQLATNLPPAYEEYKKQKQAKEYREKKWKDLKPRIDNLVADKPPIGNACTELDNATKEMDQAVFNEDWQAAKTRVDELSTKLEQHEKTYKQRAVDKKFYEEKWPALKGQIDKLPADIPFEETKTAVTEIGKAKTEVPGFAAANQYDKARPVLEKLPLTLDNLKKKLHELYEKTWAELKKQLPTSSQKGSPKEAELLKQLLELSTKVESTAASGDYVAALKQIDPVKAKLKELTDEHTANENRKNDFEKKFADMKTGLDMALGLKTDVKEVQATQNAVKAKKTEAETAAKAGDYAAGMTRLDDLNAALTAHQTELRKTPHNCYWVLGAAGDLTTRIDIKYLQANNRIINAADGYDAALDAQKKALDAVHAAKQLAVDIAMGVFFAGLGGAVGAGGAALAKSAVGEALKGTTKDAVADAAKDVSKWTARTFEKFGGGKLDKDPTEGLPAIGGSGTALARSIGFAVNELGIGLKENAQKLFAFVTANEKKCESLSVRVEEPNFAVFDSDPFLTALGTIGKIPKDQFQKVFAQMLWAKWIETEAYSVGRICSEYDCAKYTVDNFDDFFGRWAKLRKNVEQQTGQDFGLQAKLDAARAEVQKKVDEANKKE